VKADDREEKAAAAAAADVRTTKMDDDASIITVVIVVVVVVAVSNSTSRGNDFIGLFVSFLQGSTADWWMDGTMIGRRSAALCLLMGQASKAKSQSLAGCRIFFGCRRSVEPPSWLLCESESKQRHSAEFHMTSYGTRIYQDRFGDTVCASVQFEHT